MPLPRFKSAARLSRPPVAAAASVVEALEPRRLLTTMAHWRFDEPAGSPSVADASGHGNTLTLGSTAALTPGRLGNALTHSYGLAPAVVELNHSFTASVWTNATNGLLMSQYGADDSYFVINSVAGGAFQLFRLDTLDDDGHLVGSVITNPLPAGWKHIAAVNDSAANELRLYVNGTLQGSLPYTAGAAASGGHLGIGQGIDAAGVPNGRFPLAGQIDDVRLDDAALTAGEIQQLANSPTAALSNDGAVNEGSSGVVSFSTPSGGIAPYTFSYDFDSDGVFEISQSTSSTTSVPGVYLADGPGTQKIRGRVTEAGGASSDFDTTIAINNVPPAVTVSTLPQEVVTGEQVTLTASVIDPGSDQFQYTWSVKRRGAVLFSGNQSTFRFIPSTPGPYNIALTVTDDDSATAQYQSSTSAVLAPGRVTDFAAIATGENSILATWANTAVQEAGWDLEVSPAGLSSYITHIPGNKFLSPRSLSLTGDFSGRAVNLKIRPTNSTTVELWSSALTVTTPITGRAGWQATYRFGVTYVGFDDAVVTDGAIVPATSSWTPTPYFRDESGFHLRGIGGTGVSLQLGNLPLNNLVTIGYSAVAAPTGLITHSVEAYLDEVLIPGNNYSPYATPELFDNSFANSNSGLLVRIASPSLTEPSYSNLSSLFVGTYLQPVWIRANKLSVNEGDDATGRTIRYTVSRGESALIGKLPDITVPLHWSGTAQQGIDFATNAMPSVHFTAGETEKTFDVTVNEDDKIEDVETITVTILPGLNYASMTPNIINGNLGKSDVTIVDDDQMIDIDIDSDNNDPENLPSRTLQEEQIEDTAGSTGHWVQIYDDLDNDGVKDFADGFDFLTSAGETADDIISAGNAFHPVIVSAASNLNFNVAKIKVIYTDSDPTKVTRQGNWAAGEPHKFALPDLATLRLWKKGSHLARDPRSIANGGDFIKSGEVVDATAFFDQNRARTLAIEGIAASVIVGDLSVRVELDNDGDGTFESSDQVRLTTWHEERPAVSAAIGAGGTSIGLSWTHRFSANGYRILKLTSSGWTTIADVSPAVRTYSVASTVPDRIYSFRVVALNNQSATVAAPYSNASDSQPVRVFSGSPTLTKHNALVLFNYAEQEFIETPFYNYGSAIGFGAIFTEQPLFRQLFDRLSLALDFVTVTVNSSMVSAAKYDKSTDTLELRAVGATNYDVIHELVHAVDDQFGIAPSTIDTELSEALAYGASDHLLAKAAQTGIISILKLQNPPKNLSNIQSSWESAWRVLSNVGATTVAYGNPFSQSRPLTLTDVNYVRGHLGISYSASGFLGLYESWLRTQGYEPAKLNNSFTTFTLPLEFQ